MQENHFSWLGRVVTNAALKNADPWSQQVLHWWPKVVWNSRWKMAVSSGLTAHSVWLETLGTPKTPPIWKSRNIERSLEARGIWITRCAPLRTATGTPHLPTDSVRKNSTWPITPTSGSDPLAASRSSTSKPKSSAMKRPGTGPAKVHPVSNASATCPPKWSK